jgi:hypothetical protein
MGLLLKAIKIAPKDPIQGIHTWIPSKLNVCNRVNFPSRPAPIMFATWMRVFGLVGVIGVEKHNAVCSCG